MAATGFAGRRCRTGALLVLAGLLWTGSVGAASRIPGAVAQVLHRHGIPDKDVSVYVQELAKGGPVLTVHEQVPRNPGSVIKLLTTLVALETLGPAYTWRTEAYVRGVLRHGRLDGDLILKGYGDPYLTPPAFWSLVRGLRDRGLEEIRGDLVLDNSLFEVPPESRADFDGQPHRVYNAIPAALSLNFQATSLNLFPDEGAGEVRVFPDPPLANLRIENRLRLVKAPCRSRHLHPAVIISDGDVGATVQIHGTYATECPETTVTRLLMDPVAHVGGAFRSLWQEMGGQLAGISRLGRVPPDAVLIHTLESRPLGEVIRGMNKYSNNLMSRLLLLTLAAEAQGAPGTVEKGREVVVAWLRDQGLDLPYLVLENGSGLSRETRVSAAGMGRLLAAAYGSPYMPEFMASLAVAGVDGTMRQRFVGGPIAGRAHIKTGSLDDVSGLAGYVLDRDGRRWVTVMFINHPGVMSWQGKQVQDALLRWVLEEAGTSAAPAPRMANRSGDGCGPSLTADAAASPGAGGPGS
jgi:D-alanyl-D-alanine carboxypeptidase/D-alanyl-D-alanine-endopeptidase (penicillin-binding protein 4)